MKKVLALSANMPRDFQRQPNKAHPPVPPQEEWLRFKKAMIGKHWKRVQNPLTLKTPGKGYQCLLLSDLSCSHFVKKSAFQKHMRSVHQLNPQDAPIGRVPSSTTARYAQCCSYSLVYRWHLLLSLQLCFGYCFTFYGLFEFLPPVLV